MEKTSDENKGIYLDSKIIVDSCCDMTPELKERLGAVSVPLTMRLGEREFVDDDDLDLPGFMAEMKACTEKVGSASPAPIMYQEAMEAAGNSYVVTLSSQLSGSHSGAVLALSSADEKIAENTHIFDSKSASAGEVLIAVKIRELLQNGKPREHIVKTVSRFIDSMKTYFVLERYDNLLKNGRLNKITGTIISVFNIKLVMGADSDGNIALYAKTRGKKKMIERLVSYIKESGKETAGENLVISHCNNPELAGELKRAVEQRHKFKEIFVIPTGGLSSLYTDDKGIVMAF